MIHFVGMWLIAHAFQTYAFLNNVEVAEIVRTSSYINNKEVMTAMSLSKLNVSIALGYTFGELFSLIISIVICIKRKWFYLNSIIAFVCIFVLSYMDWDAWTYLKQIFLLPGKAFAGTTYYLVNGTVLVAAGIFLLLWKKGIYKHYPIRAASKTPHYA